MERACPGRRNVRTAQSFVRGGGVLHRSCAGCQRAHRFRIRRGDRHQGDNSLVGVPGNPANSPAFVTDSASGKAGDTAIHFENGQYLTVDDPDTRVQLDRNNPSFTSLKA